MEKSVKRFYGIVVILLLIISAYPIAMGVRILLLHFRNGGIQPNDYAHLVIPYASLCLSILVTTLLYPLLSKLGKLSVPAASILGIGIFAGGEWYIEGLTIQAPLAYPVFQWQLIHNIGITEDVLAFQKLFDNTYRRHYLIMSFLVILLVIGIVYSYEKIVLSKDRKKRSILFLQMILTTIFLVFCLAANISHILGDDAAYIFKHSSLITNSFYLLAGLALGNYLAGFLINKNRLISVLLPAVSACLATAAMYIGEYKMLDGALYRFGYSKFFQYTPFNLVTPADFLIILIPGILTGLFVAVIGKYSKGANKASYRSTIDNVKIKK